MLNDVLALVTRTRVITIALLFVLVQYASILHAADHPFHADEVSCETFHAIEKSKFLATDFQHSALPVHYGDEIHLAIVDSVVSTPARAYHSRAPPVSSLI
jgi:hypothetical protein